MNINEYVKKEIDTLIEFEKWWIEKNNKEPELYPLSIEDDNSGIWDEQYKCFCEDVIYGKKEK